MMTVLAKNQSAPYNKYFYKMNMSTKVSSAKVSLDGFMTNITQVYATDPDGIYQYLVRGDNGSGFTKVSIYNVSNLALVKTWDEPTNISLFMNFGESHELVYKMTRYPGRDQYGYS